MIAKAAALLLLPGVAAFFFRKRKLSKLVRKAPSSSLGPIGTAAVPSSSLGSPHLFPAQCVPTDVRWALSSSLGPNGPAATPLLLPGVAAPVIPSPLAYVFLRPDSAAANEREHVCDHP